MKRLLATFCVSLLLGTALSSGAEEVDPSKVVVLPRQAGVPVIFVGDPFFFDFCMLPGDTGVILCSAKYIDRYRVFLVEWDVPVPCGEAVDTCGTTGESATWVPASALRVIRPCEITTALERGPVGTQKVLDTYRALIDYLTP